jgi:hypothetical protein
MAALSAPGRATLALALALILALAGEHGLTQFCGCMRPMGLGLGVRRPSSISGLGTLSVPPPRLPQVPVALFLTALA